LANFNVAVICRLSSHYMDPPEVVLNAIYPLIGSENDGFIPPAVSPTPTDDPRPMDKNDGRGETLEGQNGSEDVYSDLPEGGNLQVRFQL
jgi:hypothetical protein